MEWLKDIIGVVGSAASGGLFGVLGALGGGVVKYFQEKQAQAFKKEEWAHEHATMRLQMEITSQQGSWDALKAGYDADANQGTTYKWVNAIKALYRPFLTSCLVFVTYQLFTDILAGLTGADTSLNGIFTGPELKEILKYIVYSVVFSTSTAVVWWFCERAITPTGMKNR